MKVKKYLKAVLSISLVLAIFSCSENVSNLPTNTNHPLKDTQSNIGTIKINLAQIFNNKGFSIKRYKFSDSIIKTIKIRVFGVDSDGNSLQTIEREIKDNVSVDNVYINAPEGNNQVVLIEGLDENDFPLIRLSSPVNVKVGVSTTLKVNYGTYPVATILKNLMDNPSSDVKKLVQMINLNDLNTLLNKITGYDEYTNTYTGVNPAYVDLGAITNEIIHLNNGSVPTYTRGEFDKELKGQLNVLAKDTDGKILNGVDIKINDLTSTTDSLSTKDDKPLEIKDISYGTWTITATSGNKYAEREFTISDGNLVQAINFVMQEPVVQKIEFKELEDNVPLPSSIEVGKDNSFDIDAKVTMTDRSTNTDVKWTSSDTTVATVSSGTIRGVKVGTATITAAATDDLTKSVSLTVHVIDKGDSPPTINSFSPTRASEGTVVTIKMSSLDELEEVKFNGVVSPTIEKKDDNTITAVVPNGASTGKITITVSKQTNDVTKYGTVVSQDYFIVNSSIETNPNTSQVDTYGQIFIPEGEFSMGNDGDKDKDFYPKHKVKLYDYHIDRTEVTNADFQKFIDAHGYDNSSYWTSEGWQWKTDEEITEPAYWDDTRFNRAKQPVVGVSWYEAAAYANWKGGRLPTEAEWEKSARGTDGKEYPWGGGVSDTKCNGFFGNLGKDDGYQFTADVASFTDDESPYGLKDMSGNAYEWVADWYSKTAYTGNHYDNPKGSSFGGSKVLRGGSWYNHPYFENDNSELDKSLSTYYRFYASPTNRSNYIGFRTAK